MDITETRLEIVHQQHRVQIQPARILIGQHGQTGVTVLAVELEPKQEHDLELLIVPNLLLNHAIVKMLVVIHVTPGHHGPVMLHVVLVPKQEVGRVVRIQRALMNQIQENVSNLLAVTNVLIGRNGLIVVRHVTREHEVETRRVVQNRIVPNKRNQKHVMMELVLVRVQIGHLGIHVL